MSFTPDDVEAKEQALKAALPSVETSRVDCGWGLEACYPPAARGFVVMQPKREGMPFHKVNRDVESVVEFLTRRGCFAERS